MTMCRGTVLCSLDWWDVRVPKDGVPDMDQARTYYEYENHQGLTWWFIREEIGRCLRELYDEVPKELPPKLLALVRRLDTVEGNQLPRRSLIGKLDAIEGNHLLRHAAPAEPRCVGLSDDWLLCT